MLEITRVRMAQTVHIPMGYYGRGGRGDDVAELTAFPTADKSSRINGRCLGVDSGPPPFL